jgi:hypothetical protein
MVARVKQAEGAAKPLEPMRIRIEPWKGDGNLCEKVSVALPGLVCLFAVFQGFALALLAHPWLPSDAAPRLKTKAEDQRLSRFWSSLFVFHCPLTTCFLPSSANPRANTALALVE